MDITALEQAITDDISAGIKPARAIGTVGTTNTGAVDDLNAIAQLCQKYEIWFHVDGCISADRAKTSAPF